MLSSLSCIRGVVQDYRVEYPAPFLHEIAASITEVLQGPPELLGVRGRGRPRCISTLLENEVCTVAATTYDPQHMMMRIMEYM